MIGCMISDSRCSAELDNCGSSFAPLFFLVFMVLCNLTIPYLFVTATFDTYEMHCVDEDGMGAVVKVLMQLAKAWKEKIVAVKGSGSDISYMAADDFCDIMETLPAPI